jgi:hypothetical protein
LSFCIGIFLCAFTRSLHYERNLFNQLPQFFWDFPRPRSNPAQTITHYRQCPPHLSSKQPYTGNIMSRYNGN